MLKKSRPTAEGTVKVTFVLGSQPHAHHVHVGGTFNDWQATTPMKRQKDGSWRATVTLAPGRNYEFRYLVDGNVWVNDEAADAYVPNPFGADNCLLRTPEAAPARPAGRKPSASTHARGTQGGAASESRTRAPGRARSAGPGTEAMESRNQAGE